MVEGRAGAYLPSMIPISGGWSVPYGTSSAMKPDLDNLDRSRAAI
jgi:hypothetical protein